MESELSKVQEMIEHAETELKEVEKSPDEQEAAETKEVNIHVFAVIIIVIIFRLLGHHYIH